MATAGPILVALGLFVMVIGIFGARGDGQAGVLLRRLEGANEPVVARPSLSSYLKRESPNEVLRGMVERVGGSRLDQSDRGNRLAARLSQADLKLRPAEWLVAGVGVGVLLGVLAALRFQAPLPVLIAVGVGFMGTEVFLRWRISRRRRRFDSQLGPMVLALSNGVKAGYTFGQALSLVAGSAPMPIGRELSRVVREVQLGVPMGQALGRMVKRNESEDLKLLLTAVQIQAQVGGNLASILDAIESTIRERVRIKGEVRTLTGQARASGWVLIILPFALAGLLQVIAPSYFQPMLAETLGLAMLGLAGFALLCGYAIIRKIVNVDI